MENLKKPLMIAGIVVLALALCAVAFWGLMTLMAMFAPVEKPVIYLYPVEETTVTVTLDVDGHFTAVEPDFEVSGTWEVLASPSGEITDLASGEAYPYLFWEAETAWSPEISEGALVKGSETREYLEETLAQLGLAQAEADEFIAYWLPRMEGNNYNLISFEGEEYEEWAQLTVSPEPNTVIRVFMAWQPLDEPVDIAPQQFPEAPDREGFTVVEWGGMELPAR